MPNPIFGALNNGANNPQQNMVNSFIQFMNQMKGQDPNKLIQQKVSELHISQAQLDQIQQMAQQMQGMFNSLRGMFGM